MTIVIVILDNEECNFLKEPKLSFLRMDQLVRSIYGGGSSNSVRLVPNPFASDEGTLGLAGLTTTS